MAKFTDVIYDVTKEGRKLPTSEYKDKGLYPIIDQGQNNIAGYTDEIDGLFSNVPAIIFGDHTRIIKYVDTPFFIGADGVKILKAKDEKANCKFLYYALSSAKIPNTGYNRHFKWLKEIDIPMYSEQEEKKIISKLDKICDLITLRKKQLLKLDELVKSRFIELFGDPISNPMGWTTGVMKDICIKITDGEHGSVARVDSGNVFLNAKHIKKDGTIDWDTVSYTSDEVHNKIYSRCNPEPGDILLTTTGTIGNVAIVPNVSPFSMDRGITLLKINRSKVSNAFVAVLLRFDCIQKVMNANVHASAIGHLFLNKVMRIPVIVPPIELQNQFAAFVEQTDKSKLEIQKSLEKLETLKKALMQKYFG